MLTCPTTACYNGLLVVKEKAIRVGGQLRFFGDTFQFSKKLEGRRFWRLPVMDGEFTCEDIFGTIKGVAGGNFLILGASRAAALAAAEIEPGSAAVILVYENRWAAPFVSAVQRNGGVLIANERIGVQELYDALQASETAA